MTPAIELIGIDKSFGAVRANRDIDLVVAKGSIHGIVGENGAGKSTLMSILYGFYHADRGEIRIDGKPVVLNDSRAAIACGIGMVHQHFMLVDNFTVLENVVLGAEGGMTLARGMAHARKELQRLADDYDLKVDVDAEVGRLPVGAQQRVEILKALFRGADILILDEPTGVLTPPEADHLFRILRVLRDQGKTVLLITHKLREIMAVTDMVSVMRRGAMAATQKTSETTPERLAELMVGRHVLLDIDKGPAHPGRPVLEVEGLTVRDARGVTLVDDVSLTVRAGEIVGIAGVSGNGQSELLETIAGIRRPQRGSIRVDGRDVTSDGHGDPARMRAAGVGHVPEDRHRMGLVNAFAEYENAVLGYQDDPKYGAGAFLDIDAMRNDAREKIEKYDIRPPSCLLRTASFSGGNQQKIVLAREIERDPVVLLVGQPTRGVDIGAIEFIHKRLIELRDAGKGILLVSVELDEIRMISDKVLVMFDGRLVGERTADASERELGLMMAGIEQEAAE